MYYITYDAVLSVVLIVQSYLYVPIKNLIRST